MKERAHVKQPSWPTGSRPSGQADLGDQGAIDQAGVGAGGELILAIEATAAGRSADVTWMESMLMKHMKLPSNKLLLVSEAGFSEDARTKAEKNGAAPIAPGDLPEDFEGRRRP